jgi:hypothetical protein
VFTKEDYIEKFHHFIHNLIATAILVIKDMPGDAPGHKQYSEAENSDFINARIWLPEEKERLMIALVKCFSVNMPLYVAYKHLIIGHERNVVVKECACGKLSVDSSLSLIHVFCQPIGKGNSQVNFEFNYIFASVEISFDFNFIY